MIINLLCLTLKKKEEGPKLILSLLNKYYFLSCWSFWKNFFFPFGICGFVFCIFAVSISLYSSYLFFPS